MLAIGAYCSRLLEMAGMGQEASAQLMFGRTSVRSGIRPPQSRNQHRRAGYTRSSEYAERDPKLLGLDTPGQRFDRPIRGYLACQDGGDEVISAYSDQRYSDKIWWLSSLPPRSHPYRAGPNVRNWASPDGSGRTLTFDPDRAT